MVLEDEINIHSSELSFEPTYCELTLSEHELNTRYADMVSVWCDSKTRKNVWVHYENKVYKLHDAFISYMYVDDDGLLSNCAVKYRLKEDVSRTTKIGKILYGDKPESTLYQYFSSIRNRFISTISRGSRL